MTGHGLTVVESGRCPYALLLLLFQVAKAGGALLYSTTSSGGMFTAAYVQQCISSPDTEAPSHVLRTEG